jgi:hypothetical protein
MAAPDATVEAEVIASANAFCAALGAEDETAIDSLLADELYYRHSSGRFDVKPTYMASLRLRPTVMRLENVDVRVYDDFALLICDYVIDHEKDFDGSSPGPHVEAHGLQAWSKRDGRWQLLAHQGTKEPKQA